MLRIVYRLLTFILFSIPLFSSPLLAQISTDLLSDEMKIDRREMTPFDSLVRQVRVPEIDPRQYIVIYEWQPSNVSKSRPAIRDKYRVRETTRYNELIGLKMTELITEKKIMDSIFSQNITKIEALGARNEIPFQGSLSSYIQRVQIEYNQVEEVYLNAESGSEIEESALARMEKLDTFKITISPLIEKGVQLEKQLNEINANIDYFRKLKAENDYKSEYLKWQYGKGRDGSRFNDFKPFDFFDKVENAYEGLQENYVEYYNEVAWRNAGTPDWEPIWWLNQYPWPNLDYRNIDLLDHDYRDNRFALIPYQKYSVIDNKSVLRIVFDKNQLARNENFQGSIGMQAYLYDGPGTDGSRSGDARPIEINPYSMIGEARRSIGLLNRPAGELADNLIVLIIESKNIIEEARGLTGSKSSNLLPGQEQNLAYYKQELEKIQALLNKEEMRVKADTTNLIKYIGNICDRSNRQSYLTVIDNSNFSNYCDDFFYISEDSEADLKYDISILLSEIKQKLQSNNNKIDLQKLLAFQENLLPITTYLNYFNAEVGNTREAFLNLIGKDKISFNNLNSRFTKEVGKLDTLITNLQTSNPADEGSETSSTNLVFTINKIISILDAFTDIQGSPISFALRKLALSNSNFPIKVRENSADSELGSGEEKNNLLTILELVFKFNDERVRLREYIAEKAGEILYQDLVYGTIDLDIADAGDGDVLYIQLYWNKEAVKEEEAVIGSDVTPYKTEKTGGSSTDAPPIVEGNPQTDGVAMYVAKFQLMNRGWQRLDVKATTLLVDRFNENLLPSGYPRSPSNFKPTGGATLQWSLRNDFRINKKIKFDPNTNLPRFDRRGQLKYNRLGVFTQRTFKWLEPSFGVNFSYLDFNLDETFEIGIGPSVSLFQNAISLTTGWNLMELDQQPLYFGVGFNLLSLTSTPRADPYRK